MFPYRSVKAPSNKPFISNCCTPLHSAVPPLPCRLQAAGCCHLTDSGFMFECRHPKVRPMTIWLSPVCCRKQAPVHLLGCVSQSSAPQARTNTLLHAPCSAGSRHQPTRRSSQESVMTTMSSAQSGRSLGSVRRTPASCQGRAKSLVAIALAAKKCLCRSLHKS